MLKLLVRYKAISLGFLLIIILYLVRSIAAKPDAATLAKYNLTSFHYHELILTFTIPYVVIWLLALIGYLQLRSYTDQIRDSKDGAALSTLTKGILLMACWLPFSTLLSTLDKAIYDAHPSITATLIRFENYANIVLLLAGLAFAYQGAKQLLPLVRYRYATPLKLNLMFICFAALYVLLALSDTARQVPGHGVLLATYYLPDWLIVTTVLIPRLIGWYLGLLAVHMIYFYMQHVKGNIYKEVFSDLAKGVAGVTLSIIFLRCLQSLDTALVSLSLASLLLLIYLLLIIIAVGYIYIARGSKKLQRIEDI